jgi:hypothetical protein
MLQESPIRPQSFDVRNGDSEGQAFEASANAPTTVTLKEEDESGVMAVDDADEEEEQVGDEARVPKTKKSPVGMTTAEWHVHRLTHLPYNAACRCCVAGRKRDDQHRRFKVGSPQAQAELDAERGASICADYFFPRDAPGKEGVTAVALCDRQTGWLAGHVVSSKGSGTQEAVGQVLRDLRRMGHHGKIEGSAKHRGNGAHFDG